MENHYDQIWPKSNPLKWQIESRSDRQSTWRTMDGGSQHSTGSGDQDHPQEKEMQKGKMVIWWGLTNSWEKKRSKSEVAQSCPTLCDPMGCRLPASSVHGIFQARKLEQAAISFSRGSSKPWDQTLVSHNAGRHITTRKAKKKRKDIPIWMQSSKE